MSTYRTTRMVALLLLGIALVGSPAVMATTVSVQPSSSTVSVGQTFSLNIEIADVSDLYAFQFDLGFDPSILAATNLSEGTFLPQGGSTFFSPGTIENGVGLISFTADTLIGSIPGVSGSGVLATLSFQALAAGASSLTVSNLILQNSSLSDLSFDTSNSAVSVVAAVPLPASGVLALSGLASLGFVGRRRGGAA